MKPADESEVADLVRGATGPLCIRGGGTRGIGAPGPGQVLDMSGLSGISLYEPGALTLVAAAGTPLAAVEGALEAEGQRLPFEVPDLRGLLGRSGQSTLGGVVSANASGPRRIRAGACRDSLIGVRFVDGTGAVVKNGGRVMKNVTGYDLVKLLAGAWGTLGVLTEVAFKVLPRPETELTLWATGLDAKVGVAALSRALGSPYEITGAAWLSGPREARLRIEGMAGSVAYRRGEVLRLLGPGWEVAEAAQSADLWREVRDVAPFAGRAGAVWRIHVKPSDAPGVLEAVPGEAICDWGGGLIWLLQPDDDDGEGVDAGESRLRAHLAGIGGHATLIRGSARLMASVPVFHPEPAPVAALTAGLRAAFDPRRLFNPGLMS